MAEQTFVRGIAAAAFAFTLQVVANDTVTIGHRVYKFVAAPAAAYDVDIGADLDGSISNLVSAINDSGVAGTDYGTGTVQHEIVSGAADLANDELDLTARAGGIHVNGQYLAATSPGANDIIAEDVSFAGVTGATLGAGSFSEHLEFVIDRKQVNSDVLEALDPLTERVGP